VSEEIKISSTIETNKTIHIWQKVEMSLLKTVEKDKMNKK
jgi:hypothetical protein